MPEPLSEAYESRLAVHYEKALEKNPKLEGKVIAKFVIGTDGKVVESTAEGLPPVDACVAKVVKKIEFPSNNRGTISVNYPFSFSPRP